MKQSKKMANIGQKWPDTMIPFTYDYTRRLTASEISKTTKIPRRTVARVLNDLVKISLLRYVREGKNKKYYVDLKEERTKLLIKFSEDYKALKFSSEEHKVFLMLEELVRLRDVVLFGSYAKGTAQEHSDIDILVIGKRSKQLMQLIKRQTIRINLHFTTLEGFEDLLKEENVLALEIIRNHIVFGSHCFVDLCWRFYGHGL